MSRPVALLLTVLLSLAAVLPAAADDALRRRADLQRAEEPLRDRRFGDAVVALRQFREANPGTAEAVEAWVLEARALIAAGASAEALNLTTAFLAAHGEDLWAGRMKHVAVEAYAALGQGPAAAEGWKERVEAATAPAARAAIGALHVRLADADFDGVEAKDDLGRIVKKKDVARALESYRHALEIGVADADVVRVREQVARCLEDLGRPAEAVASWHELLQDAKTGKLTPDAAQQERWLVGRGRAHLRASERDAARKDLREVLQAHPQGALHMEVLLLLGEERLATASDKADEVAFEEGVTWIRRAILEHRTDPKASEAQRRLAEAYEGRGQSERAAAEWASLVERFPEDPFVPEARDREAKALLSAGRYDESIQAWERFLQAHPNHPLWPAVREAIVGAAFAKGQGLCDADDLEGAVHAWRGFAERYPTDARAPQALLLAGDLLRERKDAEGALALWRQVIGRYGTAAEASVARLKVALALEDDLVRLEEAVKAYEEVVEKHPGTSDAIAAQERLARLKAKSLELAMLRVVGTKAPPVVTVSTRNIETLDVRVYKLDMEEYFRRKGTVLGVENLQLEVVKPDATGTWKVEDYRPFSLFRAERAVPVAGAGAYVVVASDADFTATVLFLVSDLEIVVKRAAGRDLLVWAFEREGQAAVAGARVLAAEDGRVEEVGTTAADGVYHAPKGGSASHVLVVSEKGLAATGLESGPTVSAGFESKAYVYTDRPVYRPGQEVSWRAIFLRARGGSYEPPRGVKGRVLVRDARGATLLEREAESSPYGSFAGSFALDEAAPLGAWTVQLTVPHEGSWSGTFEVQAFRKPELTVTLVPKRPVYLTGETVEAVAQVRYAFGGAVADAPLRYEVYRTAQAFEPSAAEDYAWYFHDERREDETRRQRGGGGVLIARGEARTDTRGEALLSFETAERDEDGMLVVRVAVEDVTRRWILDEGRIPVTRRDHMAVVLVDRQVVKPRQEMRVEVRTMDALERPLPRTGSLLLLELKRRPRPEVVRRDGRATEVTEEEIEHAAYPVATGATGAAEVRLSVPGPGRWRLRWRATDGRGALVTAYADVEGAGEAEDPSKDARLVAARSVVTEGEEAEVLLRSPVTGVTALLTYEGEQVLAYRFVPVQGASTLLALPVAGGHAPNVFFKVAIPGPGRLLEADTEVVVLRHLDVTVEMPAAAGPREKVAVRVRTRDARGGGVPAEVGIALIDETLFALAPDRAPAIRPFFYDCRRTNAVRTASSLGFAAAGTTRETNKDLLADEAARYGDVGPALAAAALLGAREALQRGDAETAVLLAIRASEADPSSMEARRFVEDLDKHRAVRALRETNKDLDQQLDRLKVVEADAIDARLPRPAPAPERASKEAKGDVPRDAEMGEDLVTESEEVEDGLIGLGGGAGGAFRGRGGRRDLKSGGGGVRGDELAKAQASLPAEFASRLVAPSQRVAALRQQQQAFGLDTGPTLEVRRRFADTALWAPHVVTDAQGEATVEVELPDNLTTWRALVRGVSGTALVGEGRGRLVARKDLLVRIDAPRFLVEGDQVTLPVAVHNETGGPQDVRVALVGEGVDLAGQDATLAVADGGRAVSDRDAATPRAGGVRLEATATAGGSGDRMEVSLAALPRGIRLVEGRTGVVDTTRGDVEETFLDVPEGVIPGASRLAVVLYPALDAAMLDALLALDLYPYGCIEQTVHRFLPAIAARDALRAVASPNAARLDVLDEAVRRGAVRLRNLQNPDGSFGWFGGGGGNLAMTAYAVLGLAGARASGVSDLDEAIAGGADALSKLVVPAGDEDVRALAHLALAHAGRIVEEAWATTFRRRSDDLSVSGLAWMARAAKALGRSFDADELGRLLLQRRIDDGETTHWKGEEGDCFLGSDREATGLAAEALLVLGADPGPAERALSWLLAKRANGTFGTTKETAAFVGAATAWVRANGLQAYGGRIDVLLDDRVVRQVSFGSEGLAAADRRFLVDEASELAAGRHRLGFRLTGQGRLHWAARLEVMTRSDDLPADEHGLAVRRQYLKPEEAGIEGEPPPVKPGYDVLRPSARPRVEASMLAAVGAGDRILVRIEVEAPRDLAYLLVEDPLPAGFEVLDDTAQGSFEWQERRDDRQAFFLTNVPKGTHVLRYVLQATHWGRFTALGTTASPMYLPEVHGRAAGHALTVRREGVRGTDAEHAPTPDEVWERARRLFAEEKRDEATALMRALRDEQPLRDEIVEELELHLLKAAIAAKDVQEIVRAREALVRRNPARIPDDWWVQRSIAFAYHELGEVEVASNLYRDLVVRGFGLHVDWARTLAGREREVEGLDALGEALRAFPVSNATAEAALKRALRYRDLPRPPGRAGKAGAPMDAEALAALQDFTAHFADTPLADVGTFTLVGALRHAKDLEGAEAVAAIFPTRFPGSEWEDDARYFLADARYGRFEDAPSPAAAATVREAAQPLVDRSFPDRDGQSRTSEFRLRAIHLLARVHHVLGELDAAIGLYEQAREIEDAREAYAFLTEERLALPAAHTVPLDGTAAVPLAYQNVGEVAFKAYPVDLPVLFAVRRSLEGLHDVDLAGVVPQHAWTFVPADGKDHRPHQMLVALPVEAGKAGAWLVVAKAGHRESKALVLRTDLHVEVQRLGEKVRVYVTDPRGEAVRDAYVVVSDGQRIRARGLTDGRGVFEAPGVGAGASAVISKDGRYAVAR